jgi:hypothetical protein
MSVVVELFGGMGNQLFQYAAGRAVAEEGDLPLFLAAAHPHCHSTVDYRPLLFLDASGWDAPLPALTIRETRDFAAWSPATAAAQILAGGEPVRMHGYFQYLSAIENVVPRILARIREKHMGLAEDVGRRWGITEPEQTAFLHIRRGDYVGKESVGHWNLGPEYYVPALERLRASAPTLKKIVVLCEDLPWVREAAAGWLGDVAGPIPLQIVEDTDEIACLLGMSLCKGGAVIGNSTFSWWGAMAGAEEEFSTVVYPRRWYGGAHPNLFPAWWVAAGPPP